MGTNLLPVFSGCPELEILAKDEHIRVWINGTKISDGKDTRTRFTKGRLGFQVHELVIKPNPFPSAGKTSEFVKLNRRVLPMRM
jgi:hypothetical protein